MRACNRCARKRVCAWPVAASPGTQSSCRNILTAHSPTPGAFSSLPVTKRSILQHQRCRPPLFERTIRRRVRWPGWTMLEMTFLASIWLPLSLAFVVYDCWWGGGQRSKHMPTTPLPTCRCAVFTAFPGCRPDGKQTLFAYLQSPSRQNSSSLPLLHVCSLTLCSHLRCTNILFAYGKIWIWNSC